MQPSKKKFLPLSVRESTHKDDAVIPANPMLFERHDDFGAEIVGHTNDILCVALCFNTIVATGGADGCIVLSFFDSGTVRKKIEVKGPNGQSSPILQVYLFSLELLNFSWFGVKALVY